MGSVLVLLFSPLHAWLTSSSSSSLPCLQTSFLLSQNASLDQIATAQPRINDAIVSFLAQSNVQSRIQWTNVDITTSTIDGNGPAIVQMCLYVPPNTSVNQVAMAMSATVNWSGLKTSISTLHRRFQLFDLTTPLQVLNQVTQYNFQRIPFPYVQWYLVVQGRFDYFWPQIKIKHAIAVLLNISSSSVIPQDIIFPPYDAYNDIATILPFAITQVNSSTFARTANTLTGPLQDILALHGILLLTQFPDPNGNGKLQQSVPWPEYPQLDPTSFYPFHNWTPVPNSFVVKLIYGGLLTLTNMSSVILQVLDVLDSPQTANFTDFQTLTLTYPPNNGTATFESSRYNTLDFIVAGDRSTLEANQQTLGESLYQIGVSIFDVIDINSTMQTAQWYPYMQLDCPYNLSALASIIQRIALAAFFSIPLSSIQLIEIATNSTTFEIACNDTLEQRYLKKQLKETTRWSTVMNNFTANSAFCTIGGESLAYPPMFPGSTYGWSQPSSSMDNTCSVNTIELTGNIDSTESCI
ncbi:hypothetical protein THRCLA_05822 [Thraustotheca clavata]|uniref:Secreted protein n=1 Tax=Thraustotheca clavata TaxID=74557 RepID=A0A1V9ZSC2_9STRA|nr:hypothetical protein THRCLA_05822 [Thraustotheca clavata]